MWFGGFGGVNGKGKAQKVEADSEGLPHAPRHAAKRYRAEKVWPTNGSPKQSPPTQNFEIAKPHLKYKINIRIQQLSAQSLSYYQSAVKPKMPGTTQEPTQVPILDPTSETNEEIDPAVDRDRIRVVC
jgi:hypothetical protein